MQFFDMSNRTNVTYSALQRGNVVVALRDLDPSGAQIQMHMIGCVFEEENAFGDGAGPLVRWMNMGVCNVYPNDVGIIKK